MRKKILIGVMIVMSLGILIGGHFFSRTNAQDPPQKTGPAPKSDGDLFDTIKQSLEGKPVAPVLPPPVVQQPMVPPLPAVPTNPTFAPMAKEPLPAFPPPKGPMPTAANDPPPLVPPTPKDSVTRPSNIPSGLAPLPGPLAPPPLPSATKEPAPQIPQNAAPDLSPIVVGNAKPPSDNSATNAVQSPPMPAKIADDLAKVKDSPWAMHVEMVNGQTVVTAVVHQKHEFKIVCQSLDVQTGKGTLKATGKVQITGDMLTAACDQLAISLLEDRLLLEGNAVVSIQKLSANVSSEKPASFELKGTTLDLRISDLQAKFRQAGLSVEREPGATPLRPAAAMGGADRDGKKWTPYGTLKRADRKSPSDEVAHWRLEDRDGGVIALLVARDGGTLAQFEGQSISVLGAREQVNGESVLRVTHIAVP